MQVIAHGSRDTDTARLAFSLEPRRHVHRIPVEISSICNRIANVNPDTETDRSLRWLISVMDRNLMLNLDSTAHRPVDAIEHDEKGIATSLNDPAAVFIDRRVNYVATKAPQPLERSCIVQANETAVADHVGIDDRDQLPPI